MKNWNRGSSVLAAVLSFAPMAVVAADTKPPATKPAPVVEVQADGAMLFKADGARVLGFKLHLEMKPEPTLVYWVDPTESIEWPHGIAKKGTYAVELTYSCPSKAGGDFVVAAAANKLTGKTETTDDWKTFTTVKVGTLKVLNDNTSLSLRSSGYFARALMNVRSVKLTPVEEKDAKKGK